MRSIIFRKSTQLLIIIILIVSVFLLLRGHNQPGGGFVGGLVASVAFILFVWANDISETRRLLRFRPRVFIAAGIIIMVASGLPALFLGKPYLTSISFGPFEGSNIVLSTATIFDIGVYLTVLGVVLMIILSLEER